MSEVAIRALLEARLKTWTDDQGLPVAWENVPFTPPAGAYVRFFLLPGQSRSDDLASGVTTFVGLAQADIAVPAGNGPAAAGALIESLRAKFPCSLRLSNDTLELTVTSPLSSGPSIPDESHYIVPTSFTYRADV